MLMKITQGNLLSPGFLVVSPAIWKLYRCRILGIFLVFCP
jgi:hypothetical protein